MSRRKKSNLVPIVLLGIAAIVLMGRSKPQPPPPGYYPPPPRQQPGQPQSAVMAAFSAWVAAIVALYGRSKSLFEPGGPFHGKSEREVNEALHLPSNTAWV